MSHCEENLNGLKKIQAEHKTNEIRQKKKNSHRKEEMTEEHSTVQEKLP